MKVRSFFEVFQDAKDMVDLFDGVETTQQMVSRLERLKRVGPEEVLETVTGLRMSLDAALEDTLEISGHEVSEDDFLNEETEENENGEEENETEEGNVDDVLSLIRSDEEEESEEISENENLNIVPLETPPIKNEPETKT